MKIGAGGAVYDYVISYPFNIMFPFLSNSKYLVINDVMTI